MNELPICTLVVGSSLDGKITLSKGMSSKGFYPYIEKGLSKRLHYLRARSDAILTSSTTIRIDDSSLTVRDVEKEKIPIRVIIDRLGKINKGSKVLNDEAPTIILTTEVGKKSLEEKISKKLDYIICKEENNLIYLVDAFHRLTERGINKILIEGGGTLNASLFKYNLISIIKHFIFPIIIGGKITPTIVDGQGFSRQPIKLDLISSEVISNCVLNTYLIKNKQ